MSSAASAQQSIDEMVRRIATRFSPDRIILFGSHARGEAKPGSDIDLLVLFPSVENPREKAAQLYAALAGCSLPPKDIVVSTTERFERYRNVVNTVYWPAAREGKVLYERAA
jgi:predicted nucleotidyltransferase